MKKSVKWISIIFASVSLISVGSAGAFVYTSLQDVPEAFLEPLISPLRTNIYDQAGQVIEVLGQSKEEYVEYEDLPPQLIQALISIEDIHFFEHQGVDWSRIFRAFIHNLTAKNKHGGSTITQQLVKNTLLSDEQSYKRKIQEAYLAMEIEKRWSKEEILTQYFNRIYFEQSIPGVSYAAKRYFGKDLSLISLPEAALLAGVVKSASYYNPFKYPERIDQRKNLVLSKMYEYGFIDEASYRTASNTSTSDMVIKPGENYQDPTYRFQSYLDVVYLELLAKTGLDPYSRPLQIETYLDSALQSHLDQIQKGEVITFSDDDQQIGASVVRHQDSAIVGVIGGRNYQGSRIFNRAYSLKRQPASTIKPVFGYLLAAEYLDYNGSTPVKDQPYTYPGTSITVNNADRQYAGYLPVVDALGYSKNTSALYTLEKVINRIGQEQTVSFLSQIGLMDEGPFAYPYGIGGMTYGVSPCALAGAYSILMREGNYLAPSTIARVIDQSTGEILYQRDLNGTPVVSPTSAFQIAHTLVEVVKHNYYRIGVVGVPGVAIGAKTGTNGYDEQAARELGYPLSADKDSWIAGFSPDYAMAVWTGFDRAEVGQKHYFAKGDARRQIPKQIFQNVMELLSLKQKNIPVPAGLVAVNIVRGTDLPYLPNAYIPSHLTVTGYYDQQKRPTTVLPLPQFPKITRAFGYMYDETLLLEWEVNETPEDVFDYTQLYQNKGYRVTYLREGQRFDHFTTQTKIEIPYQKDLSDIMIIPCFEANYTLEGMAYPFLL